ncbi:hypothetical protein K450DRAFT_224662 [Umbelopsis ramanniana AG]|uniref:Uncharacterized protein n=1 Tax=Umbelopsis ramanniana AG TaxID=1314678 RepID=A0AAD5EJ17_UMBRA|nr:uncharacterized protein K450DRAFT_224662 [Umbelopsis ramanniana AG]KAI8583195.1 hypothetical protein K450DRAFT_224662 [Umbelopsis ramanniana AG]
MEDDSRRKAKKNKKDKKKKDKKSKKSREHSHENTSLTDQNPIADEPIKHATIARGHSSTEVSRDSGSSKPDHWHPALSKSKHKKMKNLVPKNDQIQMSDSEVGEKESHEKSSTIVDSGKQENSRVSQDDDLNIQSASATEEGQKSLKDKSKKKKDKSKQKSNKRKKDSDDENGDKEARKRKRKDDEAKESKRRKETPTRSEPAEKADVANNEAAGILSSASKVIDEEVPNVKLSSTPPLDTVNQKAPRRGRRKEKVVAIGEQTSHLYPHRVKVYPENTDPRKIYKSRAIGVPRRPDFSVSDSDSDSDSDNEGTGPLNELHTKMVQYKANDVKKFESEGLPVKTGKWDVLENRILEKRLKKIARRRKMSFEDVQNSFFSEPFAKDREFWWSLARAFPQRTMHNIFLHTKRIFDENNYQGQWDEDSDAKLMAMVTEHGPAWAKISQALSRTANACLGRYRLIGNREKGKQNLGPWSADEENMLIQAVKKYKSEMNITNDKDISWTYVSTVFKGSRNPLQLRYKWHIISPYVKEETVQKPTFDQDNWQNMKQELVRKLQAGSWEHESQVPWATFRDKSFTLDSEASRKLYYRMRNRITGFESMSLKDIFTKLREQLDSDVVDDSDLSSS